MVAKGHVVQGGGGPGGPVVWGDIQAKPDTFPPTAHTHDYATGVTGKPATFPPSAHTHAWDEVTDKPSTFPATAHTHAIADVDGLETELATLDGSVGAAQDLAEEAAQVFIWNPTAGAYELSPGARIYIGPGDPGTGVLWINADPS